MAATKPRVQQLDQSGATTSQVLTWTGTYWEPEDATAGTTCRAYFTAVGGERVLFLGVTPITDTEQVYVNGLRKVWGGVDYAISGSAITFTSALTVGQVVVVQYATTSACGIASLTALPVGFTRPPALNRPNRRFHRRR